MRKKPYSTIGIGRVPCTRCGEPSVHQWRACADGNQWRGLCARCDVELNRLVLRFMRIPGWARKILAYKEAENG